MIINVIMPTFNDEKTIWETLDSINKQKYDNWHLTIVNDGSVDNTEGVIKKYIKKYNLDKKITYIYQDNSDQLNAIKRGLQEIKDNDGLIYICHSDDLINNEEVFGKAVKYFENNDVDAIIADLNIIDEHSHVVGSQVVNPYKRSLNYIALQGLWLGRNLFVDVAFFKYKIFKSNVYENYLTWNGPFWLNLNHDLSMLNVQKVDFPFIKYRVYADNYINNEMGMLNVLNGELRTAMNILANIHIVSYKIQYLLFRLFNKFNLSYRVLFRWEREKNLGKIARFIVGKRISIEMIQKYPYYEAIIGFFDNYNLTNNKIVLKNIKSTEVFLGSDMRKFNRLMLDNKLPQIYSFLFEQMKMGFREVETTKKELKKVEDILKFMDIYNFVKIVVK